MHNGPEMSAKRVLIVPPRWPLAERLRADGHEVVEAEGLADAVERADAGVDAVLLDRRMSDEATLAVLAGIRDRDPDPPVILLAGRADAAIVTTALADGAFDYAYEPIDPDDIARRVTRAFEVTRLRRELRTLRDRLARPFTLPSLIGVSPAMARVRAVARKIATNDDAPVLITGARGTGKDHVARVIHYTGGRAMRPILKVRCAGVPEAVLEAELFGREPAPGSDIGMHARGVFDEAHEGTVMLDDVGALTPMLQGRLLQLLETREFRRVGGATDIRVDVRVIAATTQPLEAAVRAGTFRSELYYRLNVLGLDMPPLTARREDLALLAGYFIETNRLAGQGQAAGLTPSALNVLEAHHWPGHLDELRALIDRAMMVAAGPLIDVADLGGVAPATPAQRSGFLLPEDGCDLDAVERTLVLQALERAGGNQTKAATYLGVHRDQVRYRLSKWAKEARAAKASDTP